MLHHDNVLAHAAICIRNFLTKHSTPHSARLPYLAPSNFFMFPKLKMTQKIISESARPEILKVWHWNVLKEYHKCFNKWQDCWNHCVYRCNSVSGYLCLSKTL